MNKIEREESSVGEPRDPVFYETTDPQIFSELGLGDIYIACEHSAGEPSTFVNLRTGSLLYESNGLRPVPVGVRFTVTVGE